VIDFYSGLHDEHHWTQQQIDDSDLMYLLDLIIVRSKKRGENEKSIPFEDQF